MLGQSKKAISFYPLGKREKAHPMVEGCEPKEALTYHSFVTRLRRKWMSGAPKH